jgi:hypothetical protein
MYIFEMSNFVKIHMYLFEKKFIERRIYRGRYPNDLVLPKCKQSTLYQQNCYFMAVKIYNKLPYDLREFPLTKFKAKLFQILLDKCY